MDFSVIICTYNRSHNIEPCITCLANQRGINGLEWEVVIVDNNSTDDTRDCVLQLGPQLPLNVRYVFEPEQGLNYARNRGVAESTGKYFTFIDDDILVSEDWLASLYKTLQDNDADAAGGRIHLDKSIHLPSWITANQEMYGFLGYQDFGEQPFQMDGVKRYPFGGNMAFNRRIVERIGLFNPKLGRKGEGRKRGELFKGAETDYFHRLSAAGGRIFYSPDAIVYHKVLPFQLKKLYFRTIHYNAGFQKALHDNCSYTRTLSGVPLYIFPQVIRSIGKYLIQVLTKGPDIAFRQQMTVGHFLGMLGGYYKRYRVTSEDDR